MATRKIAGKSKKGSNRASAISFDITEATSPKPTAIPPTRLHAASYHWPLLLNDKTTCDGLFEWFEGIEADREMPWRKKWIDPTEYEGREELAQVLSRRAYEVWVSEIMLQQTRVSTVIPYFNNWIAKWPTIQDLAKAEHDEVLAMWKGLGYYSRATRLHQGAKDMVLKNDKHCPVPSVAEELMLFSGIGRYTAGAVSSIVFGEAEPVLDGNVVRVLSRQLGLYVDGKDKKSSDLLWKIADRLVKHVSGFPESRNSAIPGKWNQALMELGSTVCTPRPKCGECPIRKTCRAYAEGELLARKASPPSVVQDIEDFCTYCDQLDTEDLLVTPEGDDAGGDTNDDTKVAKKRKRETKSTNTISQYFAVNTRSAKTRASAMQSEEKAEVSQHTNGTIKRKAPGSAMTSKSVVTYCSLFPKKIVKKKVAEQECVVCLIELRMEEGASKWLIEQRPAKGLLASLWQFPQSILLDSSQSAAYRKLSAEKFVSELEPGPVDTSKAKHLAALDSITHIFSHLKLVMHVHWFRIDQDADAGPELAFSGPPKRKWVDTDAMENETLSTGMRRCWELVKNNDSYLTTPS